MFKEVKRKAAVGERIDQPQPTDADYSAGSAKEAA